MLIKKNNRREFLKRVLSSSATLPFLNALPSTGASENPKKRLMLWFTPNGTIPEEHFPSGGEFDFTFNRTLEPLEPVRDELIIYKGVNNYTQGGGSAHQRGIGSLWSNKELTPGTDTGGDPNRAPVAWSGGITVDQRIAQHIGNDSRFRSLEYGIKLGNPGVRGRMSYAGADQPLEPQIDPYAAFARLYGFLQVDDQEVKAHRTASVLDKVIADFGRVRNFLSMEDKQKLEQHAQSVRDIEKALIVPDNTAACPTPNLGSPIDIYDENNRPLLTKLFTDLSVSAFACDQTSVISSQWARATSASTYPFLGLNSSHHTMSHDADGVTESREMLIDVNRWHSEQFLYLIQQLKATPDPSGAGSLMDNTFVLWGNELGKGNNHTLNDIPFVSAGSCQGYFRTGRYIQANGKNHGRLMVSVCNAFGIETNSFGDNDAGPLANLT